jgi:hypothetical protein
MPVMSVESVASSVCTVMLHLRAVGAPPENRLYPIRTDPIKTPARVPSKLRSAKASTRGVAFPTLSEVFAQGRWMRRGGRG